MTEGLLQDIHLNEVIQLVTLIEKKTGDLELKPLFPMYQAAARIPIGHIYFNDGQIHAAFLMDKLGEEALENLFLWEAGRFQFRSIESRHNLPPANISQATATLLMRGIKRLEQWRTARETIPSMRVALQHASNVQSLPPLDSTSVDYQIFAFCDGSMQLFDIVPQLGIGGLRCRETAARLIFTGHLIKNQLSAAQMMVHLLLSALYPMLGAAAEIFCDDALRAVQISPEYLQNHNNLTYSTVRRIVDYIEHEIGLVLGPQRSQEMAAKMSAVLKI